METIAMNTKTGFPNYPVPPKFLSFESTSPPGADINFQPDPNYPQDDSFMCLNTPNKRASSSQVWGPAGPMCWIAPKHTNQCDKDYTHIYVAPLEGAYEGLV